VDEQDLAGERRKGKPLPVRAGTRNYVGRDGAPERRGETRPMAAVDDLDAAGLGGRVVERGPYLELGIAVETPEAAAVLVPRELGSAARALREER
jgi:hypothetical protein